MIEMCGTSRPKSHPVSLGRGARVGKELHLPAAGISCHMAGYQAAESRR